MKTENNKPSIAALARASASHNNIPINRWQIHYLAVVAAELTDDFAGGNIPVEDLLVPAARHQLGVVPANGVAVKFPAPKSDGKKG